MDYQTFNNIIKQDNIYLIILFSICIIYIIPNLSNNILLLFNYTIVKLLFVFLIGYTSIINLSIAILLFVALFIINQELRKINMHNKISNQISNTIQPSSDHNINIINSLLKDKFVSNKEKKQLFNSVMQSIASDKHKYNTGLIYMNSCPKKMSKIINKLYRSNMKSNNQLTMSNKLLDTIDDKYIIGKNIIKSNIYDEDKIKIIIHVLNSDIKAKKKIKIMKKMMKSDIKTVNKNKIINLINESQIYDNIDGLDKNQYYENFSLI